MPTTAARIYQLGSRDGNPSRELSSRAPSGPKPPPSWKIKSKVEEDPWVNISDAEWRQRALDPRLFPSSTSTASYPISTLQELCLKVIVRENLPSRLPASFVKSLPPNIRLRIGEVAAVYAPLSAKTLSVIYGNRDVSSMILVGQRLQGGENAEANLQRGLKDEDAMATLEALVLSNMADSESGKQVKESWEDDNPATLEPSESADDVNTGPNDLAHHDSEEKPLQALALISLPVPTETIASVLPHTLLHLSLFGVFRWEGDPLRPRKHAQDLNVPELSFRALARVDH